MRKGKQDREGVVAMRKTIALVLSVLMAVALLPTQALAEAVDELGIVVQEEAQQEADETVSPETREGEALQVDDVPQGDALQDDEAIELGEPVVELDDATPSDATVVAPASADKPALSAQDDGQATTPKFHIQTAQVQGINGTTLASGPNYKHVPTTYYYELGKGDYPVPYRGDGWPLNYTNYLQASGIYFPGDKIVFVPAPDPVPFERSHGLPGLCFQDGKGGYYEYGVGDRVGPFLVSGAVTKGNWHSHTYMTELTVVDGPVMFSTESGNSGGSSWADSGPDKDGFATDVWPVGSIRYVQLPKYHPIEYRYRCNGQDIPAADLATMKFYNDQPANPEVIWAEDLSSNFIPYETAMRYDEWTKFRAGNVFTFSRPYIEGYYYTDMQIGTHGDNFWCWEPTNAGDAQTYTARFRYNGDTDFNWTFTNKKEGDEADPIVVYVNYVRDGTYPSTLTVNANGGTIDGQPERMFNFYYSYDYDHAFDPAAHTPTRDGYVFDGWYADAACTKIVSPAADNGVDVDGSKLYESDVRSNLRSYGRTLRDNGSYHFCLYAKWAPKAAKHVSELTVSNVVEKPWTGKAITQAPVLKDGNKTLVAGTDYRILGYDNNVNVGTAKLRIQGLGNYKGYRVESFSVARKPVTVSFDLEYTTTTYDGTYKKPAIKNFSCSEPSLAYNDTNFYTSYSYNCDASTSSTKARVTVSVRNSNYTGSATKEFTITPRKITPTVVLGFTKTTYNGEAQYPSVTVKDGDTTIPSSSYTVEVTNNVKVGTATDTVTLKGNYEGTGKATFQIVEAAKTLSVAVDKSYAGDACVYNDWYKQPDLVVKSGATELVRGTDYQVTYANNYYPGTATVIVTGTNAYAGSTGTVTFKIQKPNIGTADYAGKVTARRYTGKAVTPKPSLYVKLAGYGWVTLEEGSEYEVVSYANNVEVGQATMTIKGIGYFTGTATMEFSIVERQGAVEQISADNVSFSYLYEEYDYTGKPVRPDPYVWWKNPSTGYNMRLTRGNNYDVTYKNNVEPGTATIVITGTDDFAGSVSKTFAIVDPKARLADVSGATVTVGTPTYTGKTRKPTPTVTLNGKTLVKGTDYTVSYANCTKAGTNTATLTITGVESNGYTGAKKVTYSIARAAISKATFAKVATQAYTGAALTPVPALTFGDAKLVKGTDYKLAYKNNVKAGTATITVTGLGNFSGTKAVTFKIAKLTVTPAKTKYAYTGKAITPAVTVTMGTTTLKKDTHYTVKYASGRKAVGAYNIKVTLKGGYAGTKTVSFTIVPKPTTISKLTAASKAFTVTWKKQATQTTGYQVQYATDAKFTADAKAVTVKGTTTLSKKVTKLVGKKRYYVRVRTYRTAGGKNYYSSWSAAKTVTTKA